MSLDMPANCGIARIPACILFLLLTLAFSGCRKTGGERIVVGSKNFTEQIILAELFAQQIEAHSAVRVERRLNLGGTFICHDALVAGKIDLYPEYTGTALTVACRKSITLDSTWK
jgi:glycine betaine/choline ABC-type transport system substrate-binding protein